MQKLNPMQRLMGFINRWTTFSMWERQAVKTVVFVILMKKGTILV